MGTKQDGPGSEKYEFFYYGRVERAQHEQQFLLLTSRGHNRFTNTGGLVTEKRGLGKLINWNIENICLTHPNINVPHQ